LRAAVVKSQLRKAPGLGWTKRSRPARHLAQVDWTRSEADSKARSSGPRRARTKARRPGRWRSRSSASAVSSPSAARFTRSSVSSGGPTAGSYLARARRADHHARAPARASPRAAPPCRPDPAAVRGIALNRTTRSSSWSPWP
jgi:hypothetical protein